MSSHIWRKEDAAASPSEESEASAELLEQMAKISTELGITREQVAGLQSRMDPVVRESVNELASRVPLRSRVIRLLSFRQQRNSESLTLDEIAKALARREDVEPGELANLLFELRAEGRVTWDGDGSTLKGSDVIRFTPRSKSAPSPSTS
ncbi:hypothetical protein [Microbacterium sp. CH12i]|uniref:hypothetical protein n=1 Tax=Microbacterium sp. CH12i TaxID=1479651 RepID=UPI0012693B7D|nr:hypothetical protein [Microbacterium sp. CH12i]